MLKNEIRRALTSKGMLLAIVMGQIMSLSAFIPLLLERYRKKRDVADITQRIGKELYMHLGQNTPFDVWILAHVTKATVMFIYFLPIIASLPFAASYGREKKNGYIKNVIIRSGLTKYKISKYIASFISGGIASSSVVLTNLMLCFTYIPMREPTPVSTAPAVMLNNWYSGLFFVHPYIYALLYILATFMIGGSLAMIAVLISEITVNPFTIMLTPFLILMICYIVIIDGKQQYLPMGFMMTCTSGIGITIVPFIFMVVLILTIVAICVTRKRDVL